MCVCVNERECGQLHIISLTSNWTLKGFYLKDVKKKSSKQEAKCSYQSLRSSEGLEYHFHPHVNRLTED